MALEPIHCLECRNCLRDFTTNAQYAQHVRKCIMNEIDRTPNWVQKINYEIPFTFANDKIHKKINIIKSRIFITPKVHCEWKQYRKIIKFDQTLFNNNVNNIKVQVRNKTGESFENISICSLSMKINNNYNRNDLHSYKIEMVKCYHFINLIFKTYGFQVYPFICKADGCNELVIRDTEGLCGRHRSNNIATLTNNKSNSNQLLELTNLDINDGKDNGEINRKRSLEDGYEPLSKRVRLQSNNGNDGNLGDLIMINRNGSASYMFAKGDSINNNNNFHFYMNSNFFRIKKQDEIKDDEVNSFFEVSSFSTFDL
jgi:hypothetical protein